MANNDIGPGYDRGYRACSCFWGTAPSNLVRQAASLVVGTAAIDVGCGEGKNSVYLASIGYRVKAVDSSVYALRNAKSSFGVGNTIQWYCKDANAFLSTLAETFDIAVTTGIAHCLRSPGDVIAMLRMLGRVVRSGGALAFSSFNDTLQDLRGHEPEFRPLLLPHTLLLDEIRDAGFDVSSESNSLLSDLHPHIGIRHSHSITRIVAVRR